MATAMQHNEDTISPNHPDGIAYRKYLKEDRWRKMSWQEWTLGTSRSTRNGSQLGNTPPCTARTCGSTSHQANSNPSSSPKQTRRLWENSEIRFRTLHVMKSSSKGTRESYKAPLSGCTQLWHTTTMLICADCPNWKLQALNELWLTLFFLQL